MGHRDGVTCISCSSVNETVLRCRWEYQGATYTYMARLGDLSDYSGPRRLGDRATFVLPEPIFAMLPSCIGLWILHSSALSLTPSFRQDVQSIWKYDTSRTPPRRSSTAWRTS